MLEEKRQELGNELKDSFNIVFTNLVKERCGNDLKNEKQSYSNLAQDLGITYQALMNYKKDRIPEYKQLALIKDYFGVSYSYLFGETKRKNVNATDFKFDLSGSALDKLELLSQDAKQGNYISSGITNMIESLLLEKDNQTLKIMSYLLLANIVEEKEEKINYIKFLLLNRLIEQINILSKDIDLPKEILITTYENLKNEIEN